MQLKTCRQVIQESRKFLGKIGFITPRFFAYKKSTLHPTSFVSVIHKGNIRWSVGKYHLRRTVQSK